MNRRLQSKTHYSQLGSLNAASWFGKRSLKKDTFLNPLWLTELNGKIYLDECIKKRLLPFIRKLNVQRPILFWPDLATSHYVGPVLKELKKAGVAIVPKRDNLPNVLQLRLIEKFWALCKQRYCELNKPATTIPAMKRIWKQISKKIAGKSGKSLFNRFRPKLLQSAKQGLVDGL